MKNEIDVYQPDLTLTDEVKEELASIIVDRIEGVWDFFAEKFEAGERNYQYFKGNQWTTEELEAHREQFRRAYVFNEVFNKVDHIVGTENETRMDTILIPREKSDENEVEILNFIVKWVEQINNLPYVQTQIFTDALVRGFGVSGIKWDFEDAQFGYPSIQVYPPYQFVWDINSNQIDLSDAKWMARIVFMTKENIKEHFPLYSDKLEEQIGEGRWSGKNFEKMSTAYWNALYQQRLLYNANHAKDTVLPVVEYYDYIIEPVYFVYDDIKNEDIRFDSLEEATAFYNGKLEVYESANYSLYNAYGEPNLFIYTINNRVYRQTLMIGDEIVAVTDLATPFFPYDVCFAYYMHGDFWAFVDQLISPQDLINRSFSQLDYQIGASEKGIVTVIKSALDKSFTLEDFRREYSKTKPIIPVLSHEAIRIFPPEGINPQLFEEVNFGLQRLIEYAGGRNMLGYTEKAGESGRAVAERAQQAGIARLPLFDKLKIWRVSVAKKIVWYIKNLMTSIQVARIIGDDPNFKFTKPLPEILETLREIEYDIVIDETFKSESIKERYFEQLKNMFTQFPTAPEVVVPTLLEFSTLPESKKKQIMDKLEFYQQYTMAKQQQQHEDNLKQQAEDVVKRKMIRQEMEKQLQIPERLPVGKKNK